MIYVVRHGQTNLNKEGRLQGRLGLPLNEAGIEQAKLLQEKLTGVSFDYVYSSPQERAIQTAEIATGKKVIVDDRLDVYDLGEADRLLKQEVKLAGPIPDSTYYDGVEEIPKFVNRVFGFMQELETKYGKEATILISGHRCTTGCIGAYFEGIPKDRNIMRYSSQNGDYRIYSFR